MTTPRPIKRFLDWIANIFRKERDLWRDIFQGGDLNTLYTQRDIIRGVIASKHGTPEDIAELAEINRLIDAAHAREAAKENKS